MKLMKNLTLVCLVTLVLSGAVVAQTTDELVAISEAFGQAIDDHNIDAILSHFTEDGIFATTVGPPTQEIGRAHV